MKNTILMAGAAVMDITPQTSVPLAGHFKRRDSEGVLDSLHARVLVIQNTGTRLVFVLLDLIYLPETDCTPLRCDIAEALDIPPANVCVSCTHTHTGPVTRPAFDAPKNEEYLQWALPRAVEAAKRAAATMAPAEVAWGRGYESRPQYNRRFHMRDGSVRFNPGDPDNTLHPAGPTDPELPLLLVRHAQEKTPLAILANYSLHYIGDFSSMKISADYFGEFARLAAERFDPQCVAMLTHSASGDINNVNHQKLPAPWYPEKMELKERSILIAGWLLDQVEKVWQDADWHEDVEIGAVSQTYMLPVRRLSPEEIEFAKRAEQDENLTLVQRHYARNWLKLLNEPSVLPQAVSAFRVGNWGAATMTGEIFCQLGIDLKYASPFEVTALIELANGHMGYVPTRSSFAVGGYETWHSRHFFGDLNCGHEMVAIAATELRRLWLGEDEEKIADANRKSDRP